MTTFRPMRWLPLLLVSCAHAPGFTTSSHGVTHYGADRDYSATESRLVRDLVVELGWPMARCEAALAAVEVHWVDGPWTGPDGLQWRGASEGRSIRAVRGDCVAYRHELSHVLGAYMGLPDASHVDLARWQVVARAWCP